MDTNVFNQWIGGACGCSDKNNTVFQKVDELPALGDATRNHAYILPNNTVWVVNSEGTDFSQLNGGSGSGGAYDDTELRDLIQSVADRNTMEDNRLVNIENKNATQDQRLSAIENKNTEYDSYFEEVSEAIGELQSQAGGVTYTAGTGISISADNVISATGGGATEDNDTTYEAGDGIILGYSATSGGFTKIINANGVITVPLIDSGDNKNKGYASLQRLTATDSLLTYSLYIRKGETLTDIYANVMDFRPEENSVNSDGEGVFILSREPYVEFNDGFLIINGTVPENSHDYQIEVYSGSLIISSQS